MSRVCSVCGKGRMTGHKVSHSNIKTNRTWGANVQKRYIETDGKKEQVYICARCLRNSKKAQA